MGISFFHPEFLWGLLFLCVVVLIHLLHKNHTVRLPFSSLLFFRENAVRASRMRRVRKLLQLLVRSGLVAILVLIFTRPFKKQSLFSLFQNPHGTVYFWIDPTISMEYEDDGATSWQSAVAFIDSLRSVLPSTVRHHWFDNAQREFVPLDKPSLDDYKNIFGGVDIRSVFDAFGEIETHEESPFLVLLSDYQNATVSTLDSSLALFESRNPLLCISVTPSAPWNYSIRSVRSRSKDAGVIESEVLAKGNGLDSSRVTVMVDGMQVGHARVALQQGDSTIIPFEVAVGPTVTPGKLVLEKTDPLSFDNIDYFTTGKEHRLRVLLIGDTRANFTLEASFKALGEDKWYPVLSKRSSDVTHADLDSADLIVINQVTDLSKTLGLFQSGYTVSDKAIICGLAPDTRDDAIEMVKAIASQKKAGDIDTTHGRAHPVLPDTLSALWRGFPSIETEDVTIYRYWKGIPGESLIRLDDGSELAAMSKDDSGRNWIFIGTAIGVTDANNLCESGFYIPFIDRLARRALADISNRQNDWYAGKVIRNPYFGTGTSATVYAGDKKVVAKWGVQPFVTIERPGLYRVVPEGKPSYWLPVHVDPIESELVFGSPTIPENAKDRIVYLDRQGGAKLLAQLGKGRLSSDWLWFLFGLLLLTELLLWEKKPQKLHTGSKKHR